MVDPFFISRCGHWMSVLPATHPSFRRPSITASSKTTGWNFTNLHWIDRSPFKLVQRFQLRAESLLPCQPKGNTLKSCKTSCQISKESVGHPLPMLFKLFHCFKNMTARGRYQFFYVNICETLLVFFLSEIARPSKKDNTSCLN